MNTNDPVMWIDHWITILPDSIEDEIRIKPGVAHDILIQFTTPFPGVKVVNHDAENDDARRDLPGR